MFYIDITRLILRQMQQLKPTGIDRVMLAYLQHYQDSACAVVYFSRRFWVLSPKKSKLLFCALISNSAHRSNLFFSLMRGMCFSFKKVQKGILLVLGHSYLNKEQYIKAISKKSWTPIFFIHDLIPLTHPEYCRFDEKEKHRRRINHALSLAKGIIVNSRDTYNSLSQFAVSHEKELPLTCIAPLGVDLPLASRRSRPKVSPYFVTVGTIEPRKNHILLLQVWKKLIELFGSLAPKLIIIGRRGWECEHVSRMLERCSQLEGFVYEWSQCSDEELSFCLQDAQALLFPSFVEGYGLPLVEALSAGIPVIASSISVFHEIGQDVPEYIAPLDYERWISTIVDYAKPDSRLRQAQQQRLVQYKSPTWEEHFLITDNFLRSIK
ncbi:glycosyltransferase, family [Legionella massiliensis]|uniref:Glycosyltransferase, family n=1 Tax=Legionella massiliensis TaxID=1034943 RepID=A0A078KZA7_9GAMM|nr:glycosyltransferase family 1 protein [Legionella massiliensis]CDZ77109.1 glycosyltransferase, family [Legionella massiliensis]CEE12847.1 D-inositol-3-phosphate glycosyltransferase [Legionella massiliensis]